MSHCSGCPPLTQGSFQGLISNLSPSTSPCLAPTHHLQPGQKRTRLPAAHALHAPGWVFPVPFCLTRAPFTAVTLFPKVTSSFCFIWVRSDCRAMTAFLAVIKLHCVPEPSHLGWNLTWFNRPFLNSSSSPHLRGISCVCSRSPMDARLGVGKAEVPTGDHYTAKGTSTGKTVATHHSQTSCHLFVTRKIKLSQRSRPTTVPSPLQ